MKEKGFFGSLFFVAGMIYFNGKEVETVAQSGRKPKPTAIKVLEGNPGKRSLNTQEPKPRKKAPRCPPWLEEEAKKEWKRMAKQMEQLGIL